MTVIEHLNEIKKRILWIIIPGIIIFTIFIFASDWYIKVILDYFKLKAVLLSPLEYINTQLELATILTAIVLIPLILYQLYAFAKPGIDFEKIRIRKSVKRKIIIYISASTILAVLGVIFGVFVFANISFKVLNNLAYQNLWGMKSIFDFIIFSAVSCGIIFQIVVIIPFLDSLNIFGFNADLLRKHRKIILISTLIIVAWITPTNDLFTMTVLSIPTYGTVELGLLLSRLNKKEVENGTRI